MSRFSAALCRGLIEALFLERLVLLEQGGFPRLYAAASLKRLEHGAARELGMQVFRGFMPRPH